MPYEGCLAIQALTCPSDLLRSLVSAVSYCFDLFCFSLMTQRSGDVSDSCVLEIEREIIKLN